jgi:endonuclease/exonuclease/phosphatase family metal-dependent hydrolase
MVLALVASGCSGSDPGADAPAPPSPAATSASAEPPPPTASAYPSAATLDRQMARHGLHRVPPSDWHAASFRVASFNLLGFTHTQGPERRRGYAGSEARLPPALRALGRARVTVAGLQEFQWPQVRQFRSLVGERYGVYPGTTLGRALSDNSIIWRTDVWTAVRTRTTRVPYFHGHRVRMPQVLLRHRASGRLVWFANVHNPANVFGDARRWRQEAVAIEARLVRRLVRRGAPVVLTGDMNDKAGFACPFTAQSGMHSADGAVTRDGRCLLPADVDIDWIFGSAAVRFSSFTHDKRPKRLKITDHPLVSVTASLKGVEQRRDCRPARSASGVLWYCRGR